MIDAVRSIVLAVRDWLGSSGIEWWPELVKEEFGFLRDYGYELAEVHIHFQGNFVRFHRPDSDIVLSYEPGSTGLLDTEILYPPAGEPRVIDVDRLITARIPELRVPPKRPLSHEIVEAYVRFAAQGLKRIAPDVLDQAFEERNDNIPG